MRNRLGISLKLSTAYHPETDGQTEKFKQSREYLRKYVNFNQDDWVDWLHLLEFQANNTFNAIVGMTPFFADKSFHPRTGFKLEEFSVDNIRHKASPEIRIAEKIAEKIQNIINHLKINATWMQESQIRHVNKHRSDAPFFKIGGLVYVDTMKSENRKTNKIKTT